MWHLRFARRAVLAVAVLSTVVGTAQPLGASQLEVKYGSTTIPHLSTFNFGSTPVAQNLSRTFTVKNIGTTAVTIGPYGLTGTASDPNFYEYGAINVPAPLNPGQSGTFEIIYRANAVGSSHEKARLFVGGTAHHEFWMDASATSSPGTLTICTKPGEILVELDAAIRTGFPAGKCEWRNRINFTYRQWEVTDSMNLPVIAAAVALYAEPVQPGGDIRNWWKTFLEAQLGKVQNFPAGFPTAGDPLPSALKFFHSTEAFSSTYDPSVTTSVLAVHYWANFHPTQLNATSIKTNAREYLRATWGVYALASGRELALPAYKNRVLHSTQLQKASNGLYYSNSSFMALAGTRMNTGWWGADNRVPLLTAALGFNPDPSPSVSLREGEGQRGVRTYVDDWPDVFGLSSTERSGLVGLIDNNVVPSFFTSLFTNVKTRSTFHFVAQTGFAGTCMETAENGNGPHTFAVGFFDSGDIGTAAWEAQFLYPGDSANQQGHCTFDTAAKRFRVYNAKMGGTEIGTINLLPGPIVYHFKLSSTGLQRLI